jgi:hypothetical protein
MWLAVTPKVPKHWYGTARPCRERIRRSSRTHFKYAKNVRVKIHTKLTMQTGFYTAIAVIVRVRPVLLNDRFHRPFKGTKVGQTTVALDRLAHVVTRFARILQAR